MYIYIYTHGFIQPNLLPYRLSAAGPITKPALQCTIQKYACDDYDDENNHKTRKTI
jgi:hypothetical protein